MHLRMAKHTAVLADPHAIFRRGMRDLLEETGVEVIGEAEDLETLVPLLRRAPTVVFVDNAFADRGGLGQLRESMPDGTRLVFLVEPTILASTLIHLMELGAAGCLERDLRPSAFGRSIAALLRGEIVLSRVLTQRLCQGIQGLAERQHVAVQAEKLTPREREVLRYVSQAARNRDIAQALSISEHTVKRHVQNILQKLELPTRVAAATFFERVPLEER